MNREDLVIPGPAGRLAVRVKRPASTPRGAVVLVQGANITGQLGYDLQVPGHPDYSFLDALVAGGYTAVTFSIRGYGRSQLAGDPHAVQTDAAIEDLAAVIDWLAGQGMVRPHLIGWSWGGRIAGRYVEQAADRIDRLVLLDPALGGGQRIPFPGKEQWWLNSYDYFYNRLEPEFTHEDVRIAVANQASMSELKAPNGIRVENENGSIPVRAEAITRPTLMLYGEAAGAQAYMHGAADRDQFLERIANADKALVIVPGGGDYAHLQNPRRAIHRIVIDFLGWGAAA
ncbi:alpha/beta fold hydrolase [Sphingomonas sp.]|jgi:pimeloyl-ACP methyl ester carboxylesterase|uniref:alpha/beta fold hydrolase n=1 Tax=Sphingomonas sp. TaxID=28214 RepID=UPI002D7EA26D|nr:alpha/beta fold hydrolase [Sphingomonas sp.]HEU0043454.1 alpha/beta fold hydrolase [Sphingomonas sp.]